MRVALIVAIAVSVGALASLQLSAGSHLPIGWSDSGTLVAPMDAAPPLLAARETR
jgi:hypothetical protein